MTAATSQERMIVQGDVVDRLPDFNASSFDACFCDPPYGLAFMGKRWDHGVPDADTWRAILRVLKPGAPLLAFGGTRTHHRLMCAIEDAGFLLADTLCWLHAQGFPKGHSQLKPAWEPITLAWKQGKRVLNIDGCRIPAAPWHRSIGSTPKFNAIFAQDAWTKENMSAGANTEGNALGRWPANVLLDEESAAQLDAQSGFQQSGIAYEPRKGRLLKRSVYGKAKSCGRVCGFGDSGGASRFFYCAKASRSEREGNTHPTVKPLKLTEYLSRLILPPERDSPRRLLVPFSGSGSEVIGAKRAGWDEVVGIERESEYVDITEARLAAERQPEQMMEQLF